MNSLNAPKPSWKTALVGFSSRPVTITERRIVDALAEQVLAEAALPALQHVGRRLQRTLVGAVVRPRQPCRTTRRPPPSMRFSLRTLMVGAQLYQALQTIVAVDHAAVGGR